MHHSITETDVEQPQMGSGREGSRLREGPGQSPLGITAKSSTPPEKAREIRAERYQALAQARTWIGRRVNLMRPNEQFPGNVYRTFDCRYVRRAYQVGVHQSDQVAHYSGIATCGSVWACPVCAARIQEQRRRELDQLVAWAELEGLQALMVTLTFPHKAFDTLSELLERQADAFKRFRAGSPFRRLKERMGFRGLVRSLEVTHGANGWHPHTHELWLVDPRCNASIRADLIELWERACIAAGLLDATDERQLFAFRVHSVDVRFNASSADYLAKQDSSRNWGITHEVAKASSKAGRAKGVHPHEFLVRMASGDEARYFEYLESMKGRRQLFWSPGLKALCGLDEVDDQDAAEDEREDDPSELLGNLSSDEWDFIRRKRLIARVLDAAEVGGFELVERYLKRKGFKPRPYQESPPPEFGANYFDLIYVQER